MISVHLPKTAGTGFLRYLESLSQNHALLVLRDYGDQPLHYSRLRRRLTAWAACDIAPVQNSSSTVIHGHFLPYKYRQKYQQGLPFVTWLRHPVDRLRSHYDYWLRSLDSDSGPLHARMVHEKWSFERFAIGPELRNMYSEFLWRFPLSNFAFVGITEYYQEDLQAFAEKFDLKIAPEAATVAVNSRTDSAPVVDAQLRNKICQWHAKDLVLYEQAVKWRDVGRWARR